jgi:iron complex transport system ATP-binding protein
MERQMLEVQGLSVGYNDRQVLRGIDLTLADGEFLGVVGPNGSGKSTLVRALSRMLRPVAGSVRVMGREMRVFTTKELAQALAVVPQTPVLPEGFTALEVTLMGRTPHLRFLQLEGPDDLAVARRSMQQTAALEFAERPVDELSGGERQRVVVARALAQESPILLMDEPTSHLDVRHQIALFDLVLRLSRGCRLAVVAVIHDLTLAAQYCDRLILLHEGRVVAAGPPESVLMPEQVGAVYGAEVCVIQHPATGRPVVLPVPGRGEP